MNRTIDIQLYAAQFLALAPLLAVLACGFLVAILRLPRHPRTSWLVMAAMALSVFNSLGMPIFMNLVMSSFSTFRSTPELWLRTIIFTLPRALLSAAAWGLILFAVFDRPLPPKFLRDEDAERDILDPPREEPRPN